MKKVTSYLFIIGFFIPLLLVGVFFQHASAHNYSNWSPQTRIPLYENNTEEPPYLVADQMKIVHAFNDQPSDLRNENSQRVVVYRQWNIYRGWSKPISIVTDPDGSDLSLADVYFDRNANVHLLIQRHDSILYHTMAPLIAAGQAQSWSKPVFIADQSIPKRHGMPYIASIGEDLLGNLVVIYSGSVGGNGTYATYSKDGGLSWAASIPIYLTNDPNVLVVFPYIFSSETGQLHAVWSTFNADGSGGPGYYANLIASNLVSTKLIPLDEPGIRTPAVIEYAGKIIVSYYHHSINTNFWRVSEDNGQTWSKPAKLSPIHVGTNGGVSFVIDSSNQLFAFFGERTIDDIHGMWYSQWIGNGWTNTESIVRGPQIQDVLGGDGFDPRSARAIVINGNILLATWGTDGAGGSNGAWYSYTILDTPELPKTFLPTASITTTPVFEAETGNKLTDLFTPTSAPMSLSSHEDLSNNSTSIRMPSLLVGIAASMIAIFIAVLLRKFRHH